MLRSWAPSTRILALVLVGGTLCALIISIVVVFVCHAEVRTQVPLDAANRTMNIHLGYASIPRAILLDDRPLYENLVGFAYDSTVPLMPPSTDTLISPPDPSLSLSSTGDFVPEKLFLWDVESVLRYLRSELTTIDLNGLLLIHPDTSADEIPSPNLNDDDDDDATWMDTKASGSRHQSQNRKRLDKLFDRAADAL
ncbi:uncharacterized protein LY79DRAFT_573952, partial [Colletotrichum navitas]